MGAWVSLVQIQSPRPENLYYRADDVGLLFWFRGRDRLRTFILLTNDDGVHAPGIHALREAAERLWDTVIVAPDREQSAQSHALTLNRPLRVNKVADGILSVDGTPSDCMMLALRGSPDYALHNPGCPRCRIIPPFRDFPASQ